MLKMKDVLRRDAMQRKFQGGIRKCTGHTLIGTPLPQWYPPSHLGTLGGKQQHSWEVHFHYGKVTKTREQMLRQYPNLSI